jgi:hypothetical protein
MFTQDAPGELQQKPGVHAALRAGRDRLRAPGMQLDVWRARGGCSSSLLLLGLKVLMSRREKCGRVRYVQV